MALRREVERALLEVGAADHRPHAAGLVVDRDQRRARADAAEARRDRLLGRLLELEVERRADLQAAAERVTAAVAVDELLLDPRGEVGRVADLASASGSGRAAAAPAARASHRARWR